MTHRRFVFVLLVTCLIAVPLLVQAEDEGTRHITGESVDMYFMNDKVFGSVNEHPIWAIYNCGTDIKGEIDIHGEYKKLAFEYHAEGERKITGSFGDQEMSLGDIEKKESGFVYHVFIGEKEHLFSIRYEKFEDEHLVNSIIEGTVGENQEIKLTVDGHLCPFGTTGIILIAVGAALAG